MVRTQLYLTEDQHQRLRARARLHGRTLSDEVREAIDAQLTDGSAAEERRHAARLAWFDEAIGLPSVWEGDDPDEDGEAYVARIRSIGAANTTERLRLWHGDTPGEE